MDMEQQDAVQGFIDHHVMHHMGSADTWNLPFFHVDALDWLRYDAVILVVVVVILLGIAAAVRRSYGKTPVPRGFAGMIEAYVLFIRNDIVYDSFGEKEGKRFVSFFCTLFLFILVANLLGLIPLFSTATGNVSVTAGLATVFMIVTLTMALKLHGLLGLKNAFVPEGLPAAMRAPMGFMEVASFVSRVFALCIRLFANMIAGHMVIYALTGMVVMFGWVAAPALLMAAAMYLFEVFMAFLQAYVFTLLSAIFMNMVVNPEHG